MAINIISKTGERSAVSFSDVNYMFKVLGTIDREHVKNLRKEAKQIAKPIQAAVRRGIPSRPPISGMIPKVIPGRLTWGTGKPAKSVTIQAPPLKKKAKYNSIARVRTWSAAVGIADMAGRSRRSMNKFEYTRDYPYSRSPSGSRKHRITAVGSRKFIENLNYGKGVKKSSASRFVWPSGESALPEAKLKMIVVLNKYYNIVNAQLRG
jgi:hypothetical protein